jgi:putative ABC transport system substrate-binding protein
VRWLCLLAVLCAAAPAVEAQTAAKVKRLGILSASAAAASDDNLEVLRRRLEELGYRYGQGIRFEQRTAEGRPERLRGQARELVSLNVDAILAIGADAAGAAKEVTETIPIVFVPFGDASVVAGSNVTGFTQPRRDTLSKLVGQLKEVVPKAKRVAVLARAKDEAVLQEAKALKMEVVQLARAEDAPKVFAALAKSKPDALVVTLAAPVTPAKAAEHALKARLPTIHEHRDFVQAGGLMSYGPKQSDLFRQAAGYVVRILRGAKPGDLPAAQPASFDLAVNLKTATALRLTIPQPVVKRAHEVIR